MDIEKASQKDNSLPIQPKWALCHGSQPSIQTRKHVLKLILTILLLGLLALNTFQVIRGASPPNVGDHSTNRMELYGNLRLDFGDMVPPVAVDETWTFTAYTNKSCTGESVSISGTGIQACLQINGNETYNTVIVPSLPGDLRLCFYPKDDCSTNATAVTTVTGCTPAKNSTYYLTKPNKQGC